MTFDYSLFLKKLLLKKIGSGKQTNMKLLMNCKTIIKNLISANLRIGIATLIIISFAFIHSAFATPRRDPDIDKVVSGQVINATGDILNGVSITLKGSTAGTSTDAEGRYRINVPDNGTLVFTFVGYEKGNWGK